MSFHAFSRPGSDGLGLRRKRHLGDVLSCPSLVLLGYTEAVGPVVGVTYPTGRGRRDQSPWSISPGGVHSGGVEELRDPTDVSSSAAAPTTRPGLELFWIPLGAGADVVRLSGRAYEALSALFQRRPRRDLYHSALAAQTSDARFVIEMTPIPDGRGRQDRGVVSEGPVGSWWVRRLRIFRYEIRRWRDGVIPDISMAVASPVRITDDPDLVRKLLDSVASCTNTGVGPR